MTEEINPYDPAIELEKLNAFSNWLSENGCRFPKLALMALSKNFRGVYAREDIEVDEALLYVPSQCMMTSEMARKSVIGEKILQTNNPRLERHLLEAFILEEKHKPQSYWEPYLDVLPGYFADNPMFFDKYHLDFLTGSYALTVIHSRQQLWQQEYNRLCQQVVDFKQFSFDEFTWVKSLIATRVCAITVDKNKLNVMVPLFDMFNHSSPGDNLWAYSNASKGIEITALKQQLAKQEVSISYGKKCNGRFFVNYGFVVAGNQNNLASVRVSLSPQDPYFALKKDLLAGESIKHFRLSSSSDSEFNACLQFFRVFALEFATPADAREFVEIDRPEHCVFSLENEKSALAGCISCCESHLNDFDNSLEEDRHILHNKYHPYNRDTGIRNAILMRSGEKEILHYWIDVAENILQEISNSP